MLKRIHRWLQLRYGVDEIVDRQLTGYLLPRTINGWYSLGSVLLFIFSLQIVTGILLLVYYVPDADKAFRSVGTIMNQVPFGWLIRFCHAVGSNMMVSVLILHLLSVMFMGSYKRPRELNWLSGFILLNLVMIISLTGYLLPWSQLSFWATTVATNSGGAVPVVGGYLVKFLRGGEQVGAQTLGRFFALHVAIFPTAITLLIAAHIFFLKRTGISAPPTRTHSRTTWKGERYVHEEHPGGIPFFPDYFVHDMTSISVYLGIFLCVVFFNPYIFFTPEAFVPADPFSTPAHIKPEWYFLPNYQVLKIFPSQMAGLLVQFLAMAAVALLPFYDRGEERHPLKRPLFLGISLSGIAVYLGLMIWGHFS